MSITGSIQFNYFKWLTCCLRSFSLDFDLVRLDFLPDFPILFFLLQYLSIFWESTLARVSVYIQASTLDAQSKALKCLEQIAKSPTKYRALSISTGLLCKETPVLRSATLLQPCTSFRRHFLSLHSLITGKNRQETCDFSRSCLCRYEYDVTGPMPPTAR